MEYGINRNGCGYYDPTAFRAMKKIISEEKNMDFFNGDIIDIEMNNGTSREAIIMSTHDRYSSILVLSENQTLPYSVSNCRGLKYTDPGMIQYVFNDKINGFIRSMSVDEYADLMEAVVAALGYAAPVKEVVKEVEVAQQIPDDYIDKVQFHVETEALKSDLTKAQAERDVYKNLYENLINSMIAK